MNENIIVKLIRKYANAAKEISQDDFLELVEGLEEQEVEIVLACIVENGFKVIDEAEKNKVSLDASKLIGLTNEELCVLAQRGSKEAMDALVIKNERLVYKIVSRELKQYKKNSLDEEDLYVEGSIGLMKAAEKFDIKMGNKFSTYACFWIRQAITRAIVDQGFIVRIPVHMFEQVILVNKCRKHNPSATISELQAIVNNDYEKNYTFEEVQQLLAYADEYLNTTSLNTVVNDGSGDAGDTEIMDFIPAEGNVEDEVMDSLLADEIRDLLKTLTEKEHKIISLRFGLEGNERKTLEEIGSMYDVTRERIRQIEAKTIKKLSRPSIIKRLEVYYV